MVRRIVEHPADPDAHFALARYYLDRQSFRQGVAELRSSLAFGGPTAAIRPLLAEAYAELGLPAAAMHEIELAQAAGAPAATLEPLRNAFRAVREQPLERMDHNMYYRYRSLADFVRSLDLGTELSLLDVGSGLGDLGLFLPDARYAAVEPSLNGLDGTRLGFATGSIDVVVACHVLEHVPPQARDTFLDNLCRIASRHVVLLNPFHNSTTSERERLQLIIDLTGAPWAVEHLECGLPHVDDVRAYAARRGLAYHAEPNGHLAASLAHVFVAHYAQRAGATDALATINQYFNERLHSLLASDHLPTAWLIHFDLHGRA